MTGRYGRGIDSKATDTSMERLLERRNIGKKEREKLLDILKARKEFKI